MYILHDLAIVAGLGLKPSPLPEDQGL